MSSGLVYVPADQVVRQEDLANVIEALPESAVMYRVGGRLYPMKSSPTCVTCQSPYRSRIETQVINGYAYRHIIEHLPEDSEVTLAGLQGHVRNKHMPLEEDIKREIIHDRAEKLGLSLEEATGVFVDHIAALQVVLQRGLEEVNNGNARVGVTNTLRAARYLGSFHEISGDDEDRVEERAAFQVMMAAVTQLLTPEQYDAFGEFVDTNPLLRRLRGLPPLDPDEMPTPAAVVGEPCPSCGRKVPRPRKVQTPPADG